ncbi:YIP1 family protein [Methanoregula sp.]|uniref:YIP1 family protein n=1 Tax=Methanoregula sp. TaxID=2052170 RepID=UPI003BB10CA5
MASYLFDLLIKPDAFFQKRMAEKENLVKPALIILAGAILGAVAGYLTSSLTSKMMGWAGLGTGFAVAFSVIGAFIGIFVTWAIVTGIFYVISLVFNGNGSFFRCLGVIGYGFLPRVIGSLIIFVVTIVYIPLISVPQIAPESLKNPQAILGATKTLMSDPTMIQFSRITMAVSIIFLLWSAYCWIYGMKHARQLTLRNAAICVAVPVILYIIYVVCAMFLLYTLF